LIEKTPRLSVLLSFVGLLLVSHGAEAANLMSAPGDVFVSLETGPVQWRLSDGTLNRILVGTVPGTGEGMAFDAIGRLYVARWCTDPWCQARETVDQDTVEVFDTLGRPQGTFGSGYNCAPHAIVFDASGTAYVGQAGCTGAILKFAPGQAPIAFAVAPENQGSFWLDVAVDGCTIFYTSWGPSVKRFDGCAGVQLPNFNVAPVPGGAAQDLRVLPGGGVLVSSGQVIARLDASGVLVQTYQVAEPALWAGLDLVGDGTFWAANYETSNVYRFDLTTGAVRGSFNAGTETHTVVGVRVKK
jgi:outer membrane protein assembly factor BamB